MNERVKLKLEINSDLLMNKVVPYVLIVLVVLWVVNILFLMYANKTYSKEELDLLFKPITTKYGIKIVYEVGHDFFSPIENPPIPAGPLPGSRIEQIPHRVLVRYRTLLQKAFDKYPIEVIKKNLNAIYFAGIIDADGLWYGGTYDPFRRIVYLVDSGTKSDDQAMDTFHHEFSSLLLKRHSFFVNPWSDHNSKDFKYFREKNDNWETLEKALDSTEDGNAEVYEQGFVTVYGQTNFENDFNEYSALIFTYPQKFKKIMDQYPRVRSKFLLWLEFYQKLDPIFTEAHFFGENWMPHGSIWQRYFD